MHHISSTSEVRHGKHNANNAGPRRGADDLGGPTNDKQLEFSKFLASSVPDTTIGPLDKVPANIKALFEPILFVINRM